MIIRLRTNVGVTRLEVNASVTIAELRRQVVASLNIQGSSDIISLSADLTGNRLYSDNNATLAELSIAHGSEVFVVGKFEKKIVEKAYIGEDGVLVPAGQTLIRTDQPEEPLPVAVQENIDEKADFVDVVKSVEAPITTLSQHTTTPQSQPAPTQVSLPNHTPQTQNEPTFNFEEYGALFDEEESLRAPDEVQRLNLLGHNFNGAGESSSNSGSYDLNNTEAGRTLMHAVLLPEEQEQIDQLERALREAGCREYDVLLETQQLQDELIAVRLQRDAHNDTLSAALLTSTTASAAIDTHMQAIDASLLRYKHSSAKAPAVLRLQAFQQTAKSKGGGSGTVGISSVGTSGGGNSSGTGIIGVSSGATSGNRAVAVSNKGDSSVVTAKPTATTDINSTTSTSTINRKPIASNTTNTTANRPTASTVNSTNTSATTHTNPTNATPTNNTTTTTTSTIHTSSTTTTNNTTTSTATSTTHNNTTSTSRPIRASKGRQPSRWLAAAMQDLDTASGMDVDTASGIGVTQEIPSGPTSGSGGGSSTLQRTALRSLTAPTLPTTTNTINTPSATTGTYSTPYSTYTTYTEQVRHTGTIHAEDDEALLMLLTPTRHAHSAGTHPTVHTNIITTNATNMYNTDSSGVHKSVSVRDRSSRSERNVKPTTSSGATSSIGGTTNGGVAEPATSRSLPTTTHSYVHTTSNTINANTNITNNTTTNSTTNNAPLSLLGSGYQSMTQIQTAQRNNSTTRTTPRVSSASRATNTTSTTHTTHTSTTHVPTTRTVTPPNKYTNNTQKSATHTSNTHSKHTTPNTHTTHTTHTRMNVDVMDETLALALQLNINDHQHTRNTTSSTTTNHTNSYNTTTTAQNTTQHSNKHTRTSNSENVTAPQSHIPMHGQPGAHRTTNTRTTNHTNTAVNTNTSVPKRLFTKHAPTTHTGRAAEQRIQQQQREALQQQEDQRRAQDQHRRAAEDKQTQRTRETEALLLRQHLHTKDKSGVNSGTALPQWLQHKVDTSTEDALLELAIQQSLQQEQYGVGNYDEYNYNNNNTNNSNAKTNNNNNTNNNINNYSTNNNTTNNNNTTSNYSTNDYNNNSNSDFEYEYDPHEYEAYEFEGCEQYVQYVPRAVPIVPSALERAPATIPVVLPAPVVPVQSPVRDPRLHRPVPAAPIATPQALQTPPATYTPVPVLRAPLNRPYQADYQHNNIPHIQHYNNEFNPYDVDMVEYMKVEYDEEDEILARAIQNSLNEPYY